MARIWQDGFEYGAPNQEYLQNGLFESIIKQYFFENPSIGVPGHILLRDGRNVFSKYAISFYNTSGTSGKLCIRKTLGSSEDEIYFRCYFKKNEVSSYDFINFTDDNDTCLMSIISNVGNQFQIAVRKNGTLTTVHTENINTNAWYKLDIYFKINETIGAYEVKLDNISIKSESSINTGTLNISRIYLGPKFDTTNSFLQVDFDDVALNNTTGVVNNSWCGDGSIIGLFPKSDGYAAQWNNSEGFAVAESGTNTTTIKITGHGLSTNDVIYNKTRNQYRIVTVTDANTLTVSSVTSQAQNDEIVAFAYVSTITAGIGTTSSLVVISGHTLESYDVFVNTTRSNTIRRVIYKSSSAVYNSAEGQGSTVTSQAAGDSIKTFKVKFYSVSHWKACSTDKPNPQLSRIRSNTSNDIDSFDMQELTADKGVPSGASIRALTYHVYAGDSGTGGSEIKPILRSSSTNDEGTSITLGNQRLVYDELHEISPFTSSAWTRAEVDGLEAGVKLI